MSAHANPIGRAFDRASTSYDAYADLQRQVLARLLALTKKEKDEVVLDAGCGTGYLLDCGTGWRIVPFDLAGGMCRMAAARGAAAVQGDMTRLPFAAGRFDGIFSSLALQWVGRPQDFSAESRRVLRPGGWLAFSTLKQGTLRELAEAFALVDGYSHGLRFQSSEEIVDSVRQAGLRIEKTDTQTIRQSEACLRALARRLRGLGATVKSGDIRRGLMTPRQWQAAEAAYRRAHPAFTSSWEVLYVVARRP